MPIPKRIYRSLRNAALSVLAAVPNALSISLSVSQALKAADMDAHALARREMSRVYRKLLAQGQIKMIDKKDGVSHYALTEKGKELAQRFEYQNIRLKPKKGWDRQWRIIIFDIPERLRGKRDVLRDALRRVGFIKLQQSVWVYPHDCAELVVLIRKDLHLYTYVLYIVADTIEREREIAKKFGIEKYL